MGHAYSAERERGGREGGGGRKGREEGGGW